MSNSVTVTVHSVDDLLQTGYDRDVLVKEFVRINSEAWPPPVPERYLWTQEKVLAQFENCPYLLFCAFLNGKVVGTLSAIYTTEAEALNTHDWEKMSGDGTFSTHRPDGDCAFGADLSVPPGAIAGEKLFEFGIFSGVVLANRKGVFLGSRVPRYHKYAHSMSIEAYVGLGKEKTRDPEIRLYESGGFRVVKVIPGYMEDPDSLNYGVLMFWKNPYYRFTRFIPDPIMKAVSAIVHRWINRH